MKLVPKLRFPEFLEAGEWGEKEIFKLCSCNLSNGVFNDPKKVGVGYRLINVLDMYIDTSIKEETLSLINISKEVFLKNKVENGDIFFTRSSLVKSGIAYSNIYLGNSNNITFDGHLIRFRPDKETIKPLFTNYLLRTNKVRKQLVAKGKTATMTTIGQADVGCVNLSFPSLPEQQKIAACLSSLDDLITAENQKLDALKRHKKGLMQQLFPAEGDTVPKLRFPEFLEAGEWEKTPIGKKVDLLSGYPFKSSEISEDVDGIPLLRGINITEGYVRHNQDIDRFFTGNVDTLVKYRLCENDLVIGMDGSKVGKNSALITKKDVGSLLIQRVARLRASSLATIHFIFQQINSKKFHLYVDKVNTSGGIPHISATQINDFEIYFPTIEPI